MNINIGIPDKQRNDIARGLSRLLADSYTLYLKTHNFHWNVTGPHFQQLHLMFETHYNELALAVDLIAERIRALGVAAPGSYSQYAELSAVKEEKGVPSWQNMVKQLIEDHETVVRTCRTLLKTAQDAVDESTASLVGDRMGVHEKTAWMLRSLLA